jgi:hypothetical protein
MATSTRRLGRGSLAALLSTALTSACFSPGDGVSPPLDVVNFPVGVALSESGERLYVANSDFDLRYNAGTVLALDAAKIRELLPTWCREQDECPSSGSCEGAAGSLWGVCVDAKGSPCGALGDKPLNEQAFTPGRCEPVHLPDSELVVAGVRTAPFSTDIRYVVGSGDGDRPARLLLPVRGDASMHWMDVEQRSGRFKDLDCGQAQSADGESCDERHRVGNQDGERTAAGSKLPPEPASIGVNADGSVAIVGHQTWGRIALFTNRKDRPHLEEVFEGVGYSPMSAAALPAPADPKPGHLADFLVSYLLLSSTDPRPYVELVRAWSGAENAYLQRGGKAYLTPNQTGYDSRGIVVDGTERETCVESCACSESDDCAACRETCSAAPVSVFVASRSPDSLVVGTIADNEGSEDEGRLPNFQSIVPLRGGPSRVAAGSVTNELGEPERRVFVLSFDTGTMTIFNPTSGEVESRVTVGRGPQSVAIDSARALAYVAVFTDSYVSVVDLDKRHSTFGQVLLNLGTPIPPVSSK